MNYFLTLALILFVYMNFWFVVSLLTHRNDFADVAWGLGFVVLAWASFFMGGSSGVQGMIVTFLVTIWGLRLAGHIYSRNRGAAEDYRYRAWRKEWGAWFYPRSYVQVYLLQGILLYLIAIPVLVINSHLSDHLTIVGLFGIAVWTAGFFFEVVGDWQLAHFVKNPDNKGKLMTTGLWQYTRHPNYFGEVTLWWGLWIVALSVPYGWLTVVGPLTITVVILKVSGVPMLEKKMAEHPDFAAYKRTTSMFVPWLKKKV